MNRELDKLLFAPELLIPGQQPIDIFALEINADHPLAENLAAFIIPIGDNLLYDVVSGTFASVTAGSMASGVNEAGVTGKVNGGDRFDFSAPDLSGTGPLTLAVRYAWDGNTSFWQTALAVPGNDVGLYLPSNSFGNASIDSTVMPVVEWSPSLPVTANEYHVYSYSVAGSGSPATGYKDGASYGATTGNLNYTNTTGLRVFYGQGAEDAHGAMEWGAVWRRELSSDEHATLSNIYAELLVPKMSAVLEAAAGGTSLTVNNAESAAFAATVTLTQSHQLAANNAESAAFIEAVTLTQPQQFNIADAMAQAEAEAVALAQAHNLTALPAYSDSYAEAASLTQVQALTASKAESAAFAETVSYTSDLVYNLTVLSAFASAEAEAVSLTQTQLLTISNAEALSFAESVAFYVASLGVIHDPQFTDVSPRYAFVDVTPDYTIADLTPRRSVQDL